MRYVRARCAEDQERDIYRAYVAEALRLQGEGKYLTNCWLDIIYPPQVDERSGDEIAISVVQRAGLVHKGGE